MVELAKPILSWPAIIVGIIALLIVGAVIEYIVESQKKPANVEASNRRIASISQKAIQRYYDTNKGA